MTETGFRELLSLYPGPIGETDAGGRKNSFRNAIHRKMKYTLLVWTALAAGMFLPGDRATTREATSEDRKATVSLFNGKDLGLWKPIPFGRQGEVRVADDGTLTFEEGAPLTGVVWTGKDLPRSNYEISLEAKKHHGDDFICGLTFPVGEEHATFVCGGWGGKVVGISSIDGEDAVANETTKSMTFEEGRWYRIRVRVTDERMKGWIDDKEMFEVPLAGKVIGLRPGPTGYCSPLGIASFGTRSAYRKIELKRLAK